MNLTTRLLLSTAIFTVAAQYPASAEVVGDGAAETAEAPASPDIVVTGSRVKGEAPVGSSLMVIGRDTIETSNATTMAQLFQNMPQVNNLGVSESVRTGNGGSANFNFSQGVNIHAIGPYATLVMLDGQRIAPQGVYGLAVDTSIIPTIALQRIEIVPDGASAIYGSDAIAGVANLILRRQVEGIETSANYGVADNYDQYQLGIIGGLNWAGGHATLAYGYGGHSELVAGDRSYARADLRPFGGSDFRATQCNPGTIVIGGVNYAIPAGGVTPANAAALQPGTTNRCDLFLDSWLLPDIKRHNVVATLEQEITDKLSVAMTGVFARRLAKARYGYPATTLSVPATNAFYTRPPTAGPGAETIRYAFSDLPLSPTGHGRSDFYHGNIAAKLELPAGWEANAAFTYSGSSEHFYTSNSVNNAALAAALASSNPATAFNPYGGPNNPTVLAAIGNGQFSPSGRADQYIGDAGVSGSLFRLPGGDVRLAVGYQHQQARQRAYNMTGSTVTPIVTRSVDFTRKVDSIYGELLIPLFGPDNAVPGIQSLQIDVAGRYDHYSDVGSTTNPKVGVNWEPVGGLVLHGSYGTSFRAPPVYQSQGRAASSIAQLSDPTLGGALTTALVVTGGNSDTKPESAKTWSLGADFRPGFIPGLSGQIGYFNVDYRNIITALGSNAQILNQSYYSALGIVKRNPSAAEVAATLARYPLVTGTVPPNVPVLIDGRTRNLTSLKAEGIDFLLDYRLDAGGSGSVNFGVSGTYYLRFATAAAEGAPVIDMVGTIMNPVKFQARPYVGWRGQAFNMLATVNITGSYDNNLVTPVQKVSSQATIDFHADYDLAEIIPVKAKRLRLALDVTNLFDKSPPFVNVGPTTFTEGGFDASVASPVGRLVALSLVTQF
ncbi:TonB-dependent receptor [Sphingobium sp. TA15]|uniref:TonB-dependent receptor-like protein n=1 Tax=Sphingobium indicum (strain DSM 16413 / CCM 7287 / MTCC 6362 / UT26 / NBRC 101211 / UT26S) TaxID=452662 RepID=D4Z663_SPHIU|nr:TonB-dependent receptor [Sphingobium indicum]BAI98095.1 TonB-dependent receptor-like protein [Sphingobium indicum UT26S]BDD67472.1 TonB-dependent receptor [Sphingobium sp. TA15]